ncbi:trifunctional transcriptional regulator/proline dehydrogenase/L-glutamate gamma-semialdehyde dehydrogenase [Agrobacterium vitis]|uniref:trifunctional transcriptional regulator/proline dehydrogenase/L-glutamate gamma-semialdehyde dehydrogenase n=1 Tax=Agrobacterium vitis TaxID=373 RepID=UPI0009C168DE|nr:trifunctional transcriptional regulator/proline dehydrogenase/L-glutamate gamma-semialdehyde dehydrogenase [Agrobacterium vitis]MCE6076231.1 trifunctional transcriptional regulator/proline dehydrogenase/L-glutamate gamma-semialdehyde dehydrogenase [Agrobacterium vitis]MCM2469925.1 trifunctional transcriptional regulator/proline dehydrogenase/L-glutamate gamma-semialdehyde dehydrogenase [Agrobacterium vitis]MUO69792.1 trifunctional transcriptional regulator/proline dehydrogenase/L-glutamate ga
MNQTVSVASQAVSSSPDPIFAAFAPPLRQLSPLRQAITAAYRRPEPECLAPLLEAARLPDAMRRAVEDTARTLIEALRAKHRGSGVEGLVHEYSLSSQEGVALMCLAEALLRIPDHATRDALIRDKIAEGDWKAHLGGGRSLFVNAATWGLVVTGKLTSTVNDRGLSAALTRLIARCGEPVIRRGVDMAMRMMGEQFVTGETIEEALKRARPLEARGFRYSYDMLGEAATTAGDAARYFRDYQQAIHAIGKASAGRGIYDGPGISIKLSALHPRYSRVKAERVMGELLPQVKALALLAKHYDIGLNIDAEEADRLELSLDLLEDLCLDPALSGWDGMGFVVQAYGKRCPFVLDFIIDLARRAERRIMVRLVKGAYWDAEIKRAQVDGLEDFPVYTRKVHTDVSYIACAKKLLAARDVIFPQFATHNAQTLAAIYHLAGPDFKTGSYEFQCLHGMGEPLYDEVVGKAKLDRPCRIYAPVGTHETLLAYLVRRLLENGANSSFVNRIADPAISVEELIADPTETVLAMAQPGAKHDRIALPADLFEGRKNSAGLDLSNEAVLQALGETLRQTALGPWDAAPALIAGTSAGPVRPVVNPGDHRDVVGLIREATEEEARQAVADAAFHAQTWAQTVPLERARMLDEAADLMQARLSVLLGLIMREAGKSAANAIAEVREAIDFLRYYAEQARRTLGPMHAPLGPIVCISPWNFPLAIFTGQVAAALVAGNPVLAKPAEETPLIAAEAVRLLHQAGVPGAALQLLPGDGRIGAALVASPQVAGVMFTGSTEVAKLIQRELAGRLLANGRPIPLIAETGGQNAMIVDSSALAEQVVADVIASAFDSAGQRCSALRVLCLQEEVADRVLAMLKGALHELTLGRTDRLSTDIGPVITAEAKGVIEAHIDAMRAKGKAVEQIGAGDDTEHGTFVAPTIIEIGALSDLKREVFGPVLHVLRYRRNDLDRLIDQINATGYGLTFGLHTRLDETIAHVTSRVKAGNLYINRNVIGAVVGVQPFGGRGLSGTGPKAGGPLYLGRLVEKPPVPPQHSSVHVDPGLLDFAKWLDEQGETAAAEVARSLGSLSAVGLVQDLPGPVGERNLYALHPRGTILLVPRTSQGLYRQVASALATGNRMVVDTSAGVHDGLASLPDGMLARIRFVARSDWADAGLFAGALLEGEGEQIIDQVKAIAALPGPLVLTQAASSDELAKKPGVDNAYCLNWLVEEVSVSTNTAAAGGNASLMAIG